MPIASLNNTDIAYFDRGEGPTILLVHGFASTKEINWVSTGWVKALSEAGYRIIAHDNRGHGQSEKFYSESDYTIDIMANDAIALLDHLGIEKTHVLGYSMGARISCTLGMNHGHRFEKIILGGNGYGMVEGNGDWDPVREALLAQDESTITDARGMAFRKFADRTKGDRKALAACVGGVRQRISAERIAEITNPVLVAIGTKDDIAGSGEALADLMPNASYLPIPGRDHMLATGDKAFVAGALEFLNTP
ncbi:MAG: alpha/beta hydrolase [Rhizobiaceae bacterium]|nr:alpha/beta hydrolase [Rhizobiaceae bacterium]